MGRNRARTTVWTRAPLPSNTPSSSLKNAMEQRTDKYVPKGTDLASSSKKKAAKGVEQTEIILGETYEDEEEATFPTSPLSGSALSPPVAPPPLSDASSSPVAASTELAMAAALEALSVCGDDTHWTLSSLWDEIDSALSIIRSKSTLLQVTDMSLVLDKVRAGLAQGIELPLGVLARVWKNLEEVWDSGVALHKSGNISEGTERDVIDGLDRLVSSALGLPFGDGAAAVLESWSSHLHTISSAAFIQDLISSVVDEASNLKVNPMRPWLVGGMFLEHSSVQSDPSHVSAGLHTRLGKLLQLLEESSPNYAACIKSLTVSDVLAVANAVLHRFVWWNSTAREHVASIRRVLRHPPALGNAVTRIQLLADVQKLISREMTSSASCMDIQHIPSTLSLSSSALEELSKRMHTVFLSMQPSKRDEHLRSSICAFMQSCVSMTMPQSRLHLIGSCVNGTTVSDSDLDFVVELPSYAPCTAAQFLCCLSQVLCSQQRGLVDNVERVLNARVPIVRCEVYRTRCDVSCHVLLGVHNSGLLRVYCSADSRVRVLAVLTKYWAGRRNIRNPYERSKSREFLKWHQIGGNWCI
mmetsp:Transcript_55763/g.92636  ORF Transcript_55763/g.92636 Transcript_55763/m.92636 type:complete len:584 (-) Transcript_55763:1064-2815(-)